MPTLYSPSKKYFNRNDSSFHGGPRRASFSSSKKKLSLLGPFGSLSLSFPLSLSLLGQISSRRTLSLSLTAPLSLPPSPCFAFNFYRISRNFDRKVFAFIFHARPVSSPRFARSNFMREDTRWISRNFAVHLPSFA